MIRDEGSSGGWRAPVRYPDPAVQVLDERFREVPDLQRRRSSGCITGCRWAEGPVWFGDGRYLLWSDIPNDRILRGTRRPARSACSASPSNYANGNTRDRQGRLVTCEHGGRRVTRTEYDGTITVLIDRWEGKRLNSPNDVVVNSDGSIWFTDPPFGILGHYEGHKAESGGGASTSTGSTARPARPRVVADDVLGPNGLCFSPDERILYVVESRGVPNREDPGLRRRRPTAGAIRASACSSTPAAAPRTACAAMSTAICGAAGAWATRRSTASVVFAPDGTTIGRIALPERCANVCFGGRQAQPPVHGREPVALRALRQHPGRSRRLRPRQTSEAWP